MTAPGRNATVELSSMPQLANAKDPDDDWTGLKERSERRKRQNRLNVRAHRKRKAIQAALARAQSTTQVAPRTESMWAEWKPPESHRDTTVSTTRKSPRPSVGSAFEVLDVYFPLSGDHLITLIHYNVLRASITNVHILGLYSLLCQDDMCHPLSDTILFPHPDMVPDSLLPTPLQSATPHDEWIDLLPSPVLRDNAILNAGAFSQSDLVSDVVGCESRSHSRTDAVGMIAWSDPWHPRGWEVTPEFASKWSFLLKGCRDMLEATNSWRASRGEGPIAWEV